MIDFTDFPDDLLLARGRYSTVRSAHEDQLKTLQQLCGALQSVASQILRKAQPVEGDLPEDIFNQALGLDVTVKRILSCYQEIELLAKQRAELKQIAWPKE